METTFISTLLPFYTFWNSPFCSCLHFKELPQLFVFSSLPDSIYVHLPATTFHGKIWCILILLSSQNIYPFLLPPGLHIFKGVGEGISQWFLEDIYFVSAKFSENSLLASLHSVFYENSFKAKTWCSPILCLTATNKAWWQSTAALTILILQQDQPKASTELALPTLLLSWFTPNT